MEIVLYSLSLVGGIQKNPPETKMATLSPNSSGIYFWDRIWASGGTSEVPSDFLKFNSFVEKKKHFFLVDMPLRGGARSSQKVTVLSQNSTPFGPFSMWFGPLDA